MSSIKHYLIANRHGPSLDKPAAEALEKFLETTDGAGRTRRTPVGRYGARAPEERMRDFQRDNPSLVVEEDEELRLFGMPGLLPAAPCGDALEVALVARDAATGQPVADATVYGFGQSVTYKAITDQNGEAVLKVHEPVLERLLISARHSYWSRRSKAST